MLEARVAGDAVRWYALTQREFAAWVEQMRNSAATEITVYDGDILVYDAWRWSTGFGWQTDFRPPADWGAIDILPPQGSS